MSIIQTHLLLPSKPVFILRALRRNCIRGSNLTTYRIRGEHLDHYTSMWFLNSEVLSRIKDKYKTHQSKKQPKKKNKKKTPERPSKKKEPPTPPPPSRQKKKRKKKKRKKRKEKRNGSWTKRIGTTMFPCMAPFVKSK